MLCDATQCASCLCLHGYPTRRERAMTRRSYLRSNSDSCLLRTTSPITHAVRLSLKDSLFSLDAEYIRNVFPEVNGIPSVQEYPACTSSSFDVAKPIEGLCPPPLSTLPSC